MKYEEPKLIFIMSNDVITTSIELDEIGQGDGNTGVENIPMIK